MGLTDKEIQAALSRLGTQLGTNFGSYTDLNYLANVIDQLEAELAHLKAEQKEPDPALLVSMALRFDHGFGLSSPSEQQVLLTEMRKLWEEVTGNGFYKPENREFYLKHYSTPPQDKEGGE